MNGVSKTLLSMTVLLVPAMSMAQQNPTQPFSYSYVELGYDESDFELGSGEIDGDGLTVSASWALNEDWHVYGSYGTADLDFGYRPRHSGHRRRVPLPAAGRRRSLRSRALHQQRRGFARAVAARHDEDGLGLKCESAIASPTSSKSKAAFSTSTSSIATRRCKPWRATTSTTTSRPVSASRSPATPTRSGSTPATRSSPSGRARSALRARARFPCAPHIPSDTRWS